jgi:hypothetical protein
MKPATYKLFVCDHKKTPIKEPWISMAGDHQHLLGGDTTAYININVSEECRASRSFHISTVKMEALLPLKQQQ